MTEKMQDWDDGKMLIRDDQGICHPALDAGSILLANMDPGSGSGMTEENASLG
jgi:hypothetical protein